ncbi:MAG: helix-turn-helix domain-containing protein [Armatimonadia bacterium]
MAIAEHTQGMHTLNVLLGSEARAAILRWFFLHRGQEILLRELAEACGLSVTPVHRQLGKLEQIGLIESRMIGNSKAYRLNEGFPGLKALGELVTATVGAVPLLKEALAPLDVKVAFIFGSVAQGRETVKSDVDLIVIGDVAGPALSEAIWSVEEQLGREVNQVHYGAAEFSEKATAPSSFLSHVLGEPKLFIIGDEDALRELAQA